MKGPINNHFFPDPKLSYSLKRDPVQKRIDVEAVQML